MYIMIILMNNVYTISYTKLYFCSKFPVLKIEYHKFKAQLKK